MGWKDTLNKNKDNIKQYAVEFGVSVLFGLVKRLYRSKQEDKTAPQKEAPAPTPPPIEEKAPEMTFLQSPNCSGRGGNPIQAIILHHTGAMTTESTVTWFQSPKSGVSAHYVIGRDGKIVQMVKDEEKSWHAGDSVLHDRKDVNRFSIGIELVGDGKAAFPQEQYEALAWVVRMLKTKYKIEDKWIVGHKDIAPGRKVDPEPFDWDLFWSLVNK